MCIYQSFVLTGGYSIYELSKINYHKLYVIKSELFKKKDGKYEMIKSRTETQKWMSSAKSDITIQDLRQLRRETKTGEHEHIFEEIRYNKCIHCGLGAK